jgi:hypothetical protein
MDSDDLPLSIILDLSVIRGVIFVTSKKSSQTIEGPAEKLERTVDSKRTREFKQ